MIDNYRLFIKGEKRMERKCEMFCYGYHPVPDSWINIVDGGINRLYYINSGESFYIENGKKHPFRQGMLYFIPYYACVPTYTDEKNRLVHTFVNFRLFPPIVSEKVFELDPSSSPELSAALTAFCELCRGPFSPREKRSFMKEEEKQRLRLLSALTVFLTERAVATDPQNVFIDSTVITALDIMHSELYNKPTVEGIAKKCFMSTDGFIRKFTRLVGETPYSYFKKLKVRIACTLRAEGVSLERVAEKCGYSDASALLHAIASEKNV